MSTLFRREAVDAQRDQGVGRILLVAPVSLIVLGSGVLVAALAVAALLCGVSYSSRQTVAGYLAPAAGTLRLFAPETGTVAERRVVEGRSVHRGDVLFVLWIDRATLGADTSERVGQSLDERRQSLRSQSRQQTELLEAQRAALDKRIAGMRSEAAPLTAQAALQRDRLALAQAALQRLESLGRDNFIAPAQVQAKGEEVLALQAQAQALERDRATLDRDIATLESQRRELQLRHELDQRSVEGNLASLAKESAENDARRQVVIRAPADGVVSAIVADVGQSVGPGVALANLVPNADAGAGGAVPPLQAELYAPSSAVGFLQPGQTVRLRYQAYPYQRFGHHEGRITQVSRTPLQTTELASLPLPGALAGNALGQPGEPLYRITVALGSQSVAVDGREQPLLAGMQLDADVLLERHRLIEWLFEPVLRAAGRG